MRLSQLSEAVATDIAVFYGGRFQPMHKAHHKVYMDLVEQFGSANVFIATMMAKNAEPSDNPLSFSEKQMIMTGMFDIPQNSIVNTQPYRPDVSLVGKDPNNTAVVLVYSKKDKSRLSTDGFLRKYTPGSTLVPSTQAAYVLEVDINEDGMSASDFRDAMKDDLLDEKQKQSTFMEFFGAFDDDVYNFLKSKIK
jgi:hypothetical protein|tara:strand:+ start:4203 stop:4784 length:582 start_codon:yes stop_codon:yes gene_type:complete